MTLPCRSALRYGPLERPDMPCVPGGSSQAGGWCEGPLEADSGGCLAHVRGEGSDDVPGVAVYSAQGVGRERPLEIQPYVDQAGMGERDPAGVQGRLPEHRWVAQIDGQVRRPNGDRSAVADAARGRRQG